MTTEIARAKVNLCLHVTGQRADGYHLLDSLVTFADVGDVLHVVPAERLNLVVEGPFAAEVPGGGDNLVLQAARLVGARVSIRLEKHLPVASGIGGGSADAAACLRALARLGFELPPVAEQARLGADVPVCVAGQVMRMRGIGEVLEPVGNWPGLHAVLVNPGGALSTPKVFAALSETSKTPLGWPPTADATRWLAAQRNDLEVPATGLKPEIAEVVLALRRAGAGLARMCGSGATCYGLFPTGEAAQAVAEVLAGRGWWAVACALAGSDDA